MKVSAEVEIACSLAAREAQRRRHDLLTVEHLLYALLHDAETAKVVLSGEIKKAYTLKGVAATKGARAAIEAAGGKIEA